MLSGKLPHKLDSENEAFEKQNHRAREYWELCKAIVHSCHKDKKQEQDQSANTWLTDGAIIDELKRDSA